MIQFIDCIEQKVESLRKEVKNLVDQRDHLSMTVDVLKNNEFLENLEESNVDLKNLKKIPLKNYFYFCRRMRGNPKLHRSR